MKKTVTMIDPPSGWKYGFPKVLPQRFDTWEEQRAWLVSEGYPQREIDLVEIISIVNIGTLRLRCELLS